MKKIFILSMIAAVAIAFGCQSCNNDDDSENVSIANALVTAKTAADGTFYLQLDNTTTALPTNISKSPFDGKQVRALTNIQKVDAAHDGYTMAAKVNWIDSILTKQLAPATADNVTAYGNDPIEIVRDWVTIAEDGYLTLRFRTVWGGKGTTHTINLVKSGDADAPYVLQLRHNAKGDTSGVLGDALVAFDLSSLPDTKDETVTLTIKWMSFTGEKSTTFKYCSRKSGGATQIPFTDALNNGLIK